MNDDQRSIIDLLVAATGDLKTSQRRIVATRVCEELRTNPRFAFLQENIWHGIDLTVAN